MHNTKRGQRVANRFCLSVNKQITLFINNLCYRKDYSMNIFEVNNKKDFSFSCIYLWRNLINNKVYIGQTINFYQRMHQYLKEKSNRPICLALNKYGFDNFSIEILEKDIVSENITEREQYWIDFYQSFDKNKGYNICPVAESTRGYHHTEEDKIKMSVIAKTRFKEHPEKIKRGAENPQYGKHLSEETRQKMSKSRMGNQNAKGSTWTMPDEMRKKLSERMKGKRYGLGSKRTPEQRARISEANRERVWTEEARENSRRAHMNIGGKRVLCEETGKIYPSVAEAGRDLEKDPSSISKCCRGIVKSAYGFHWQYID